MLVDSELGQFSLDARSAPGRIGLPHWADESDQLTIDSRPLRTQGASTSSDFSPGTGRLLELLAILHTLAPLVVNALNPWPSKKEFVCPHSSASDANRLIRTPSFV
jgi:hypothetical protein